MPTTKWKKRVSSRASRKRFARMHSRSIGLECLERRSLMASDLAPFLQEAGGCLASEADQPSAVTSQSIPSVERSVEEIANSPISLLEGDVIELEVPDFVLLNYTAQGSYALRVAYAQNYFSFATNAGSFDSLTLDRSGARDMLDSPLHNAMNASDARIASNAMDDNEAQLALSQSNANTADDYTMLLLASLTATQDFDGNVRMLDYADQKSVVNASGDSDRLPSEIRIEPKLTAPTALRDPGPTVIKTIVVNRIADGLAVSESTSSQPAQESKGQPETPAPNISTQDATPSRPSRSTINLKTIDISQSRRSDTNRSWIRSSAIPNSSHPKDFGFQAKPTSAASHARLNAPASPADIESNAKPQRKAGTQNAGTKLVPVEFLLSKNLNDLDRTYSMHEQNGQHGMATDQAIREFMEESENPLELDPLEQLRDLGLLAASRVQSDDTAKTGTAVRIDDSSNDWSNAAILYMQGVQLGVASNQESWKRMLRTASESAAGQMVLASLSALVAQKGEANAFGSKSAWEFVNKPPKNS